MIDIHTALKQSIDILSGFTPDPRLEAELLLAHVLKKNRAFLFTHPEQIVQPDQLRAYQELILQRKQGKPIAYLTKAREFWSLQLEVNGHTLIPRHETELLVELVLKLLPNEPYLKILDLGTGSGAIALAIAKERPQWDISACDYSIGALETAKRNSQSLGINNVSFYHSNWFENLPEQNYHAIVANPPYIAVDDPHLKEGDVRFEPQSALVSGQDGFADLQYIVQHSYNRLLPNGLLLLEHGYDQKIKIKAILDQLGYTNVTCWQDIQGQDRVSGGWLPVVSIGDAS